MQIQYLEIVTADVSQVCSTYESTYGVEFSSVDHSLGSARTAQLKNGGMIGVRLPMSEAEVPIVRPYVLVDDIDQAVKQAQECGAEIIHPPLEIRGHGTFAIYILAGGQHGLWQL